MKFFVSKFKALERLLLKLRQVKDSWLGTANWMLPSLDRRSQSQEENHLGHNTWRINKTGNSVVFNSYLQLVIVKVPSLYNCM